ncbi:MAG: hypothetical protein OEV55_09010 [candidate division Zixibacteria bacterium]|nr:hypothetical protein [candidate division Zixibacteria bacterium]
MITKKLTRLFLLFCIFVLTINIVLLAQNIEISSIQYQDSTNIFDKIQTTYKSQKAEGFTKKKRPANIQRKESPTLTITPESKDKKSKKNVPG